MITRLNHVQITIPIGAEQAARAFYCDQLRLEEIEKPESLKDRGGLWLRLGNQEIHLGVENGVDRMRTKAHLAYEVTDLSEWRKRLAKANIPIIESIPIPGYNRMEYRDPFGNRIEMMERMSKTPLPTGKDVNQIKIKK